MLDTPRSEVVWRVLATHSTRQFPLHFLSRASPCAITFRLHSFSEGQIRKRHLPNTKQKRYAFGQLVTPCPCRHSTDVVLLPSWQRTVRIDLQYSFQFPFLFLSVIRVRHCTKASCGRLSDSTRHDDPKHECLKLYIIIFIYRNSVVTRWRWLFYM